jgi:hypothetical protein
MEDAFRGFLPGEVPDSGLTRVRQIEEVAEEVRRFRYTFGPLIEETAAVQWRLRQHPDFRELEPFRVGPDGQLGPEALACAERLTQLPAVAALATSAARQGCKGMGLLTASAEAAAGIGVQAGAELVWLWPYKIGTFRAPSRVCRSCLVRGDPRCRPRLQRDGGAVPARLELLVPAAGGHFTSGGGVSGL